MRELGSETVLQAKCPQASRNVYTQLLDSEAWNLRFSHIGIIILFEILK